MKKFLCMTCALLAVLCSLAQPKVAVVLSGGGAKGTAHIGALKVLEKADIPVDMVVGTSMGALIGGLYSMGYTTAQLDSLLRAQDWKVVLSDEEVPEKKALSDKMEQKNYAVVLPFSAKNLSFKNAGLINGVNLGHLFYQLTWPYHGNLDSFDDLPIPFSCVAVDLASGKIVDFHSGSLQDAMRSSMSIPGVFSPVRKDGMVYIDGGMKDNFPTDVARKMGADVVVGVDVGGDQLTEEEIKSFHDVFTQTLDLAMGNELRDRNIKDCDVYIHVDTKGYSSGSFTKEAIDTLIRRGEDSASRKWDDLVALRKSLDEKGKGHAKERKPKKMISMKESLRMEEDEKNPPVSLYTETTNSAFGASLHYDNIDKVALLLGLNTPFHIAKREFLPSIVAKLGKQNYFKPGIAMELPYKQKVKLSYEYHTLETEFYTNSRRAAVLEHYDRHMAKLEFQKDWNKVLLSAGADYNFNKGDLVHIDNGLKHKVFRYMAYHVDGYVNTLDNQKFPTRGHLLEGGISFVQGVFGTFRPMDYIARLKYQPVVHLSKNFTLIPKASYRYYHLNRKNSMDVGLIPAMNTFGGLDDGNVLEGQQAFAGATHLHLIGDYIGQNDPSSSYNGTSSLLLSLEGRFCFCKRHYIIGTANTLSSGKNVERTFKKNYVGGKLAYLYRSLIGPASLEFHYSNLEKDVQVLVSLGYVF